MAHRPQDASALAGRLQLRRQLTGAACSAIAVAHSCADVWALGCVLYELTTLRRAFTGSSLPALVVKILR